MGFRLSTYFATIVACVAVLVFVQNWLVGLALVVASASLVLPLYGLKVPTRYFYVQLFSAVALWITHLARVPFLVAAPDLFLYPRVGVVTTRLLSVVLLQFALYSILFFLGLWLAFHAFERSRPPVAEPGQSTAVFLRASSAITLVAVIVFLARAFLQLGLGLFTKNVANPRFGFLGQLVPHDLLYPVAILYLAKYRKRIPQFEALIFTLIAAGMIGLTLIGGSRRTFATMGLALFIFFLAHRGDFRISIRRSIAIVLAGAWLLMFSFALARPVRALLASRGGYAGQLGTVLARGVKSAFTPDAVVFLGNAVSRRLSLGMDGMVAVKMYRAPLAIDAMSPANTVARALAKFIPHYQTSNSMSSGKAIGVAYSGHSLESKHAGGLGLLASLSLTFGERMSFVAVSFLGLLCAGYFRVAARARDADIVYMLHFIGMHLMFAWLLSGNLDGLLASTILNIVLFSAYGFTLVMMVAAARLPRQRLAAYSP